MQPPEGCGLEKSLIAIAVFAVWDGIANRLSIRAFR
jgi:hypothetical protein